MTKEDVKNLDLVLIDIGGVKEIKGMEDTDFQGIANRTKLDSTLIQNKLLPILISRGCVVKKIFHSGPGYMHNITPTGREYLTYEKFKKEYEQEQRFNKEVKLLNWRIKTYWIHIVISALAFGMSTYLFIRSLI